MTILQNIIWYLFLFSIIDSKAFSTTAPHDIYKLWGIKSILEIKDLPPVKKYSEIATTIKDFAPVCNLANYINIHEKIFPFATPCAEDRTISLIYFSSSEIDQEDLINSLAEGVKDLSHKATDRIVKKLSVISTDIGDYQVADEYIDLRFETDDPKEGFLVVESTSEFSYLAGFLLFTGFASWSKDLQFDTSTMLGSQLQDLINFQSENIENDHIEVNYLAEISLLFGIGSGQTLINLLNSVLENQNKFHFVILDSLKGADAFYKKNEFQEVNATSTHRYKDKILGIKGSRPTLKRKSQRYKIKRGRIAYHHFRFTNQILCKDDGDKPSLLRARPVKKIFESLFCYERLNSD